MTDPLADSMIRFTKRAAASGIPYNEALIDALDTWVQHDEAYEEWRQTDEAKNQCGGVINIEDLPPPVGERLRAVAERERKKLGEALGGGAQPGHIEVR